MKLLILNGPNLNLLGQREPDIYGHSTYADLCGMIADYAKERGHQARFVQSNHEGALIDAIQLADADGHRRHRHQPRCLRPLQLRHPRRAALHPRSGGGGAHQRYLRP